MKEIRNQVIHGDAIETLRSLPDKSVDLILTDPPYGTTANSWDTVVDMKEWFALCHAKLKEKRALVFTGRNPFSAECIVMNKKNYKHSWVWNKNISGSFQTAKFMPLQITEDVMVFCSGTVLYNPQMRLGAPQKKHKAAKGGGGENYPALKRLTPYISDKYFPTNVLDISRYKDRSNSEREGGHPTQKPVALFEYLIKTYSNPGDLVLDCFAGSGTTAIACMNTGRDYILVEKEQKYIDVINKRILDHQPVLIAA